MKNIYIIGRVIGNYRTQNLVKFLLDREFKISFSFQENRSILLRILNKLISFVFIIQSDIVILPAMCNKYQYELILAKFLRKEVIVDFYLSIYDTLVLDRQKVKKNSKEGRKYLSYDRKCINMASKLFFLNKAEAFYYLRLMNIEKDVDFQIIPICVESKNKCSLPYSNGHSEVFKICWWGSYIPLHGLEEIIEAMYLLKERSTTQFHLYIFGTDEEKSKPYRELILSYNLEKEISIDNSSTFNNGKLGPFLVENCDLVLGNFGDSEKAKTVLVNKLVDGAAMRAPILTGYSKGAQEYFSSQEIYFVDNKPLDIGLKLIEIMKESNEKIIERTNLSYSKYLQFFSVDAYYSNLTSALPSIKKS